MRNPILKKAVAAFAFLFATTFMAAQTISYPKQTCTGSSPNCVAGEIPNSFDFSIANLPGAISDFEYFWDFKDGSFSNVYAPKHTFKEAGSYEVTVQYTRIAGNGYDDDPPPETVVIGTPIVLTTGDISGLKMPNIPSMYYPGVMDLHESQKPVTRDPEAGDIVTYVIRVRSQCLLKEHGERTSLLENLYFEYNPAVFDVLDPLVDTDEYTFGNTHVSNPTQTQKGTGLSLVKVLNWDLSVLDLRDSFSVFIHLQVKSGLAEGAPVKIQAYLTDPNDDPLTSALCGGDPSVSGTADIAFSHDPNIDVVNQELICPGNLPNKLDYTIHFQNTGVVDANKVEVTVWFDEYMDLSTLVLGNAEVGADQFQANSINIVKQPGKVIWTFNNTALRGTADPTLLNAEIEDTKGFITFSIGFNQSNLPQACSAIFNQASIIFDCNPPVYTTPSVVRVGCDTPDGVNCVDCQEVLIKGQTEVPSYYTNLSASFFSEHRFPNLPDDKAPGYILLGRKVPTGDQCFRTIVMVEVPDCILEVQDNSVMDPNCGGGSDIKLEVLGGTPPFLWQDCDFQGSGNQYEMLDVAPGIFTMAVTDSEGCVGEVSVLVPGPNDTQHTVLKKIVGPDTMGNISIGGGTPPYTLNVNGAPVDPVTNPFKLIVGTNTIIITDANGCSISFDDELAP